VIFAFLQYGGPEGLLLALPLRAVLGKLFAGLDPVLAPPAFGVWPTRRPLEVLAREAVPRLQLNLEAILLLARATVASGFCFLLGRYLLFFVLASYALRASLCFFFAFSLSRLWRHTYFNRFLSAIRPEGRTQ